MVPAPYARPFVRNAPIAARLALAFGLLLAVLAGVVGLALKQLDRVGESSRRVAESSLRQVLLARQAERAAETGAQALHSLFLLDNRAERVPVYATLDAAAAEQKNALATLLSDAHDVEDAVIIERLIAARGRFDTAFNRTVDEVELDVTEARPLMIRETMPALREMIAALDALVAAKSSQADATIASIHVQQESSRRYVLDLAALAVLVALGCAFLITRSITRPLA